MNLRLPLFLLGCSGLAIAAGAAPTARVELHASVPLILQLDAPELVRLAPGETRRVLVRIASNGPWHLVTHAANPHVRLSLAQLHGLAGGYAMAGNTRELEVRCDPAAPGPQVIALDYSLVAG